MAEKRQFEADFANFSTLNREECAALAQWQLKQIQSPVDQDTIERFIGTITTNADGRIELHHYITAIMGPWRKVFGQTPHDKLESILHMLESVQARLRNGDLTGAAAADALEAAVQALTAHVRQPEEVRKAGSAKDVETERARKEAAEAEAASLREQMQLKQQDVERLEAAVAKAVEAEAALAKQLASAEEEARGKQKGAGLQALEEEKKAGAVNVDMIVTCQGPPPRPPGMAAPNEVDDAMRDRQTRNPELWTMTMQECCAVIEHIIEQPEYIERKRLKRSVSMYDICTMFVKPWTKGTGCGLAVLMSKHREEEPKKMLSHAWGEDVEECISALKRYFELNAIDFDIPIWFCVFANYQCEDGCGPTVAQQLEMDPFARVIESPSLKKEHGGFGMVAVHTTMEDLYKRLWCVYEVDKALEHMVDVSSAMSEPYVNEMVRRAELFIERGYSWEECLKGAGIVAVTINAKCGYADDEKMLIEIIQKKEGGFNGLDAVVRDFRLRQLPEQVQTMLAEAQNTEVREMLTSTNKRRQEAGMEQLGTMKHFTETLTSLTCLNLDGCRLTTLPEGVIKLINLDDASQQSIVKILLLPWQKMEVLPETLFNHPFFGLLRKLDLFEWKMTTLPEGISNLVNLVTLNLNSCSKLQALPDGFGELKSLQTLDLSRSGIVTLPEGFEQLVNLECKSFMACMKQVKHLPESIVEHPHLRDATKLDLSGANLVALPKGISNLVNLKELNLYQCNLQALPDGISDLVNLVTLDLYGCTKLQALPDGICNLTNLTELNMILCKSIQVFPTW